jgi:nucleoside-diphosphate-sugar epimerase
VTLSHTSSAGSSHFLTFPLSYASNAGHSHYHFHSGAAVTPALPVITQAREVLGWEPKVQLEAGLKKTIEYFAQSL